MSMLKKSSTVSENLPDNTNPVIPVILSGGSGSRLWPVSRKSFPKQFWPLLSQQTLLQETALRGVSCTVGAPIVVCNQEHRFIIAEQLREVGITDARIVLEPMGRNSAPAIAAAALLVAETDPNAVLWIMAADAAISKPENLRDVLGRGVQAAREGHIVTFGMTPTRPDTGYGYIRLGPQLAGIGGVYQVSSFIEKPDAARAEEMLGTREYLWNSGMFLFRAGTIIEELEQYAPDVLAAVRQSVKEQTRDADFIRLNPTYFSESPDISIDYAVAERTQHAAVVPADLGWSDVGSWDALWELSEKDEDGNVTSGDVFLSHSRNCYVRSDGIVAAVSGVDDLIVVVTQDAVLVSHRDHAQDVKQVVSRLEAAGRPEARTHNRNYRPWGFYEGLTKGDRFQVKRIVVDPGRKLSLQKHFHRAEHWVVVEGTAIVTRDNEEHMVRENESIYLPLGSVHRLLNPGRIPLTLIEVQSGPYLGEDDIVRIEDDYARV